MPFSVSSNLFGRLSDPGGVPAPALRSGLPFVVVSVAAAFSPFALELLLPLLALFALELAGGFGFFFFLELPPWP